MFGGSGSWSISSKLDPRWDCSGTAQVIIVTGGWPTELRAKFNELKDEFGDPPADLTVGVWKD